MKDLVLGRKLSPVRFKYHRLEFEHGLIRLLLWFQFVTLKSSLFQGFLNLKGGCNIFFSLDVYGGTFQASRHVVS